MGKRRKPTKSKAPPTQAQLLSREQISIVREVDYIISRAQDHDARLVTLGTLVLFATGTGDAWILDSEDNLALCLARNGERQTFKIIETATNFGIEWNANYRLDGDAFTVIEKSGRVKSILGYPTREILQASHQAR